MNVNKLKLLHNINNNLNAAKTLKLQNDFCIGCDGPPIGDVWAHKTQTYSN